MGMIIPVGVILLGVSFLIMYYELWKTDEETRRLLQDLHDSLNDQN